MLKAQCSLHNSVCKYICTTYLKDGCGRLYQMAEFCHHKNKLNTVALNSNVRQLN